jgi:hypothetical protein
MRLDAVFEGRVFKPAQHPGLSDGSTCALRWRPSSTAPRRRSSSSPLRCYDGLSPRDVDEIEEMVH